MHVIKSIKKEFTTIFDVRNKQINFFSVALQPLKDLGRLTYRTFLELFRHMVRLLGRVISPSQGLYPHRTTQHRKTQTNIHALSGIRTHDPSNQPAKTHASGRTATVTGNYFITVYFNNWKEERILELVGNADAFIPPSTSASIFLPHLSFVCICERPILVLYAQYCEKSFVLECKKKVTSKQY
jgi:hypothetical protein